MPKIEYSECIFPNCAKPLGQDSKDLDWRVCKDHRACYICSEPLEPLDIHLAHERAMKDPDDSIELAHARCLIASGKLATLNSDPTLSIKQSTYDLLNAARLMVDPDMSLSNTTNENNAMIHCSRFIHQMNWDQKYATLKMMEACVATVSLAIAQDRKQLKARASEREEKQAKVAKKQAETSSRPVTSAIDSNYEVSLAEFMKNFNVKDRKVAISLQKLRDKAAKALEAAGISATMAKTMADADLMKNRQGKVD